MAFAFVNGAVRLRGGADVDVSSDALSHTSTNAIIVFTSNYTTGGVAVTGVTDSGGNTYIKAGSTVGLDANHKTECWIATNITGSASNTVTAAFAASATSRNITVLQYSGLATASTFDAMSTMNVNTNGTAQNTNAVTTTASGDLILAHYVCNTATQVITATNGAVIRAIEGGVTTDPANILALELAGSTAGSYTVTATTAINTSYAATAYAFKIAGGGGGSTQAPRSSAFLRMLNNC